MFCQQFLFGENAFRATGELFLCGAASSQTGSKSWAANFRTRRPFSSNVPLRVGNLNAGIVWRCSVSGCTLYKRILCVSLLGLRQMPWRWVIYVQRSSKIQVSGHQELLTPVMFHSNLILTDYQLGGFIRRLQLLSSDGRVSPQSRHHQLTFCLFSVFCFWLSSVLLHLLLLNPIILIESAGGCVFYSHRHILDTEGPISSDPFLWFAVFLLVSQPVTSVLCFNSINATQTKGRDHRVLIMLGLKTTWDTDPGCELSWV